MSVRYLQQLTRHQENLNLRVNNLTIDGSLNYFDPSAGGGILHYLTGNTGGAVAGNALGNINILGTADQIAVSGNPATETLTLSLNSALIPSGETVNVQINEQPADTQVGLGAAFFLTFDDHLSSTPGGHQTLYWQSQIALTGVTPGTTHLTGVFPIAPTYLPVSAGFSAIIDGSNNCAVLLSSGQFDIYPTTPLAGGSHTLHGCSLNYYSA